MMIEFNEKDHSYKVDGKKKESVTQLLKRVGIIEYSEDAPNRDYYLDRGTRAHKACLLSAQGWLDWSSIEGSDIEGFVTTCKDICEAMGLVYMSGEVPSYSEAFDLCGTYDLKMEWAGKIYVVELKTGIFPMWGGLQLAGYETMTECDGVLGISLKSGKVYHKADDFLKNTLTLDDIVSGKFDLAKWKSNKKRRYMVTVK